MGSQMLGTSQQSTRKLALRRLHALHAQPCASSYTSAQVPNFVLAAPVFILTAWGCWSWMTRWLKHLQKTATQPAQGFHGPAVGPYVLHWGLSAAIAVAVMNVQVSTR